MSYQPYPKFLFHDDGRERVVQTEADHEAARADGFLSHEDREPKSEPAPDEPPKKRAKK